MQEKAKFSLAHAIKEKTGFSLKIYAKRRNLSLSSLYKGYLSENVKEILKKDGIIIKNFAY